MTERVPVHVVREQRAASAAEQDHARVAAAVHVVALSGTIAGCLHRIASRGQREDVWRGFHGFICRNKWGGKNCSRWRNKPIVHT
eukprot:2050385-Pleurochrysis_carterae.AAC.1